MKRRLLITVLAIPVLLLLLATITLYGVLHTTTGARLAIDLLHRQLPGVLETTEPEGDFASGLQLRNVRYREQGLRASADQIELAFTLEYFPLRATVSRLQVQSLALRAPEEESTTESSGEFPTSMSLPIPLTVEALEVNGFEWLDSTGAPVFEFDRLSLAAWMHETLKLEQGELKIEQGRLGFNGQMGLNTPFPFDFDMDTRLSLEFQEDAGPAALEFQARLGGDLDRYQLSTSGWIDPPDHERHQVHMLASGNLDDLLIQELRIGGPLFQLASTAELIWQEQILRVSMFNIELLESAAILKGTGSIDLEQETVAAEIRWTDFSWPLGTEQPEILSQQGNITLSGDFDDWKVSGDIKVESPGLAPGALGFEASGDRERARVTIVDGRILGGVVTGQAEYGWSRGGSWSADVLAEGIQTGSLYPALSGTFNADLNAQGGLEPFHLEADIRRLDGVLRGQQLTASGRLQWQDEQLELNDMILNSADSTVALNGNTASVSGLEFQASILDMGTFLPDSSGGIEASGRLSLHAEKPRLQLELEGQNLVWEDINLPSLRIFDSAVPSDDTVADLQVEAIEPQFGGKALDGVSLRLNIARSTQSVQMTALKSGLELTMDLQGALQRHGKSLAESDWVGQLRTLGLKEGGEEIFRLLEPAEVSLAANQASITAACLSAKADSHLCLDAGWQKNGEFHTRMDINQVSLQKLQPLLDLDLEATQFLDGWIELTGAAGHGPSGHAAIHMSPGEVRYSGESDTLFETGQGELGFKLDKGDLSAGRFYVPLPGRGEVDLDFSVDEISSGLDAGLEGRLKIELAKLDILTIFLPMVDQAEGRFDADLTLSGKAADPDFSGQLSLADGRLVHEASGFIMHDINLSGQVRDNQETQLSGSFRVQEGAGRLHALVDLSEALSPRVQLNLEGENLTLFNVPDLKLVAEPDIQLNWQEGMIQVDGRLLIPSAHIAPSIVPQSPVVESPDLLITAGELPGVQAEPESKSRFAVTGDLEVTLGDDIELDLTVADANVSGSVVFSWQDELLPIANGNYELVGQILAFGQHLRITQGDIGFPGVPADNPHLNIRAERQIYGNSEIRRAGVFVAGTLSRPVIEPYTEPMTNRERAQTLLITGSDFNMERGVGAVDIGTYIAPRIFVSYGLGVFEDENVVSIRYDLGRSWGIKATSGERQTGLDISYTIER